MPGPSMLSLFFYHKTISSVCTWQPDASLWGSSGSARVSVAHPSWSYQAGCTRQKTWKSERKKKRITHSIRNGGQPADSVHQTLTHLYLLRLHLASFSMLALSPISPLQQQLAAYYGVLGRCSQGYNSVQRVKRIGGGEGGGGGGYTPLKQN